MNETELQRRIPGWGADLVQGTRPGVPMERSVAAAPKQPELQPPEAGVTHRMEIDALTPVFSSVLPPAGLSGTIRRFAYAIPEHKARHWLMLLMADRVDVLESRAKRLFDASAATHHVWAIGAGIAGVGALVAARSLKRLSA